MLLNFSSLVVFLSIGVQAKSVEVKVASYNVENLFDTEDIEIDPISGNILISLTNNKPKKDFHGSILKIKETNGKFDALTFSASTFIAGGEETGLTCPDNLAFDLAGNLWITSDISGSSMNKKDNQYTSFKNNALYVIPRHGKDAGNVIRVASAPKDAELTGPWFSPDGKTLFLSVQHPGEQTKDVNNPTSTCLLTKTTSLNRQL